MEQEVIKRGRKKIRQRGKRGVVKKVVVTAAGVPPHPAIVTATKVVHHLGGAEVVGVARTDLVPVRAHTNAT